MFLKNIFRSDTNLSMLPVEWPLNKVGTTISVTLSNWLVYLTLTLALPRACRRSRELGQDLHIGPRSLSLDALSTAN